MPHYTFKAKKGNEIVKGEQDAKDRFELYKILKEEGEEVISVEEKKKSMNIEINLPFLSGIKMQEKINFARSLSSMIKAGLSMSQALSVMERQGKNKKVKQIIATLNEEIRKGKTLSEAMKAFPKMFSPLMIAMVASGEQSGSLSDSLGIVAIQMDKTHSLQKRVRGALMYPSIILLAMILIAIVLLTYVVPTLTKTFTELNVALPMPTRVVLWFSDLIRYDFIYLVLAVVLIVVAIYSASRKVAGKKFLHYVILKIPVVGGLIQEVNVARTARTLASLLSAGVEVVESIRITGDIVQNVHYKKVLEEARVSVEKGEPLSKVFSAHEKLYPVFLGEMTSVGEETGKIGEMMYGVAVYYEDDVDQKTKDMSTIIEPFLMIIIAAAVGFFAVGMISPMYSLVNVI